MKIDWKDLAKSIALGLAILLPTAGACVLIAYLLITFEFFRWLFLAGIVVGAAALLGTVIRG